MTSRRQQDIPPPYVSFEAFKGALDWLEQEGLPQKFDDSVWRRRFHSPSYSAQMMMAFRYLGLIRPDRTPSETLEELAFGSKRRAPILAQILRTKYPDVFQLDLHSATPRQIEEAFSGLGVQGHTLRKAVTFFIHACRFTAIQLSPYLTKPSKGKNSPKKTQRPTDTTGPASSSTSSRHNHALEPLLQELEVHGPTWTTEQRDRWLAAWRAVVDLLYPAGN